MSKVEGFLKGRSYPRPLVQDGKNRPRGSRQTKLDLPPFLVIYKPFLVIYIFITNYHLKNKTMPKGIIKILRVNCAKL